MVFGTIVNGTDSLISLSAVLLLVYRNSTDFYTLILYLVTLLNSCINPGNILVQSFGCSTQNIMSSVKSESLTSLPIQMPFISFCCLIAEATTSNIMLNNSGESGHPCRFLISWGKLSVFPIKDNISCGLFIYGFYDVKVCSFYTDFLEGLY